MNVNVTDTNSILKSLKTIANNSKSDTTIYAATCDHNASNGPNVVGNDRFSSDETDYGSDESLHEKINQISNSLAESQLIDPLPQPQPSTSKKPENLELSLEALRRCMEKQREEIGGEEECGKLGQGG